MHPIPWGAGCQGWCWPDPVLQGAGCCWPVEMSPLVTAGPLALQQREGRSAQLLGDTQPQRCGHLLGTGSLGPPSLLLLPLRAVRAAGGMAAVLRGEPGMWGRAEGSTRDGFVVGWWRVGSAGRTSRVASSSAGGGDQREPCSACTGCALCTHCILPTNALHACTLPSHALHRLGVPMQRKHALHTHCTLPMHALHRPHVPAHCTHTAPCPRMHCTHTLHPAHIHTTHVRCTLPTHALHRLLVSVCCTHALHPDHACTAHTHAQHALTAPCPCAHCTDSVSPCTAHTHTLHPAHVHTAPALHSHCSRLRQSRAAPCRPCTHRVCNSDAVSLCPPTAPCPLHGYGDCPAPSRPPIAGTCADNSRILPVLAVGEAPGGSRAPQQRRLVPLTPHVVQPDGPSALAEKSCPGCIKGGTAAQLPADHRRVRQPPQVIADGAPVPVVEDLQPAGAAPRGPH